MFVNLGACVLSIFIIHIMAPAVAMRRYNEEQFVDGEFPYYPFRDKIYSLSDGLSDDDALANENSVVKVTKFNKKPDAGDRNAAKSPIDRKRSLLDLDLSQKASFYEFRNDTNTVIDATKPGVKDPSSKSVESKSRFGKIGRLVKSSKAQKVARVSRSSFKREDVAEPEIQIGFEEQQTHFLDDELNAQPVESLANQILKNFSSLVTQESKSAAAQTVTEANEPQPYSEVKPTVNVPVRLNGPYENHFTGSGGFRYTNPNTWLAKEIEKYIHRKDFRWLDFMKNNGLDTNSISEEPKHSEDDTKVTKTRITGSRQRSEAAVNQEKSDSDHQPQEVLLHQIDSLLEDLSQFKASVKHDQGSKKILDFINARNIRLDGGEGNARDTRSVTLPSFRSFKHSKPIVLNPQSPSVVQDDLRDLKKNIFLYASNVRNEANRQDLKDLRLHIKLYVENNEKTSDEVKK